MQALHCLVHVQPCQLMVSRRRTAPPLPTPQVQLLQLPLRPPLTVSGGCNVRDIAELELFQPRCRLGIRGGGAAHCFAPLK